MSKIHPKQKGEERAGLIACVSTVNKQLRGKINEAEIWFWENINKMKNVLALLITLKEATVSRMRWRIIKDPVATGKIRI